MSWLDLETNQIVLQTLATYFLMLLGMPIEYSR